jgi:glycosyltransferase involved in cell wall biosynthesis
MNIAFCLHISLAYGGGGEKWALTVANTLKKRGHNIQIFALPYTPKKRRVTDIQSLLAKDIQYNEGWSHEVNADVAYVFYNPLSYVFFRTKCPTIAGFHSSIYFLPKTPPITYGVPAISARLLYKLIGRVDLSFFNAVHVVSRSKIKHRKIFYIPNFVNTSIYKPRGNKREKFTVLFAGRPSWQKGWDIVLETAALTKKELENVNFLWVGGYESKIQNLMTCLGYVKDELELSRIYSAAHLTLFPARADTFGNTIVESLACGTPVATTPTTPHRALGVPLFYGNSAYDFCKIIKQLKELWTKDRNSYLEMSRRACEMVKKYDMLKIIPRLEKMFVEVAKTQLP